MKTKYKGISVCKIVIIKIIKRTERFSCQMITKSSSSEIALWPADSEVDITLRPILLPCFMALKTGISEFTFANIYLFRKVHQYRVTNLGQGLFMIRGRDGEDDFFMLPFSLPDSARLRKLFESFAYMKNASPAQAATLGAMGYHVREDKDNFDYLYLREGLATLDGRKFHRKRNRVRGFVAKYECSARPLCTDTLADARIVLEGWREANGVDGDYAPAIDALAHFEELCLVGSVYYVAGRPVAYAMGEALPGEYFAVHFEKGLPGYAGLLQFVNQNFAKSLPEKYRFINREQDLGIEGLRKAKLSYRPDGFIKKYRIYKGTVKVTGGGDDSR